MNTDSVLVDVAVKDLSGAALDWAVAKALGYVDYPDDSVEQGAWWYTDPVKAPFSERIRKADWKPSTDWRQGGPLFDKCEIELIRFGEHAWYQRDPQWNQKPCVGAVIRHAPYDTVSGDIHIEECMTGETRLIAACRAIVAAKLGDIVKVPACLVTP